MDLQRLVRERKEGSLDRRQFLARLGATAAGATAASVVSGARPAGAQQVDQILGLHWRPENAAAKNVSEVDAAHHLLHLVRNLRPDHLASLGRIGVDGLAVGADVALHEPRRPPAAARPQCHLIALHDGAPLVWLILWIVAPHPRLGWREIGWALLPPALYIVYAMGRGLMDGWYAYWFLNPTTQSPADLLISVAVLICGFAVMALALIGLDRRVGRKN